MIRFDWWKGSGTGASYGDVSVFLRFVYAVLKILIFIRGLSGKQRRRSDHMIWMCLEKMKLLLFRNA